MDTEQIRKVEVMLIALSRTYFVHLEPSLAPTSNLARMAVCLHKRLPTVEHRHFEIMIVNTSRVSKTKNNYHKKSWCSRMPRALPFLCLDSGFGGCFTGTTYFVTSIFSDQLCMYVPSVVAAMVGGQRIWVPFPHFFQSERCPARLCFGTHIYSHAACAFVAITALCEVMFTIFPYFCLIMPSRQTWPTKPRQKTT